MIDVVLPALDEVAVIASVVARMPPGFRAIVVDNGSSDGTGEAAATAGATVVVERSRGFGAACFAGLVAATSDVVCFMDADGSLDPGELPAVADPVTAGHADLVLGARRAQRGAWPLHARLMNRALSFELRRRTGTPLHDLGPMRAARRTALLELGITDRRFGWPLEMVAARGPGGVDDRRGAGRLRATCRAVQGHRHGAGHRAHGARHGPRARRMSSSTVIVIAKSPVPGRVKTRCCPPCTPVEAAELAGAALADTLDAVGASAATHRVVALDGSPGPWLPAGFRVIQQRGRGLGVRIDNAFAAVGGPALLIGMDTPQVTAGGIDRALELVASGRTGAVVGPALDGGFWALGLAAPAPGLCATVPMSTASTGARLCDALARRGIAWHELDELADVDDVASAATVAAAIPTSRFAATFAEMAARWPLAS